MHSRIGIGAADVRKIVREAVRIKEGIKRPVKQANDTKEMQKPVHSPPGTVSISTYGNERASPPSKDFYSRTKDPRTVHVGLYVVCLHVHRCPCVVLLR